MDRRGFLGAAVAAVAAVAIPALPALPHAENIGTTNESWCVYAAGCEFEDGSSRMLTLAIPNKHHPGSEWGPAVIAGVTKTEATRIAHEIDQRWA